VRPGTTSDESKLQQIVRRASTSSVRYRRAMMLLASAGGNHVPVIAQLVQADEDTVRDVIHHFNEIGLARLDPRWAGGRPRQLSPDDEDFVVATASVSSSLLAIVTARSSRTTVIPHLLPSGSAATVSSCRNPSKMPVDNNSDGNPSDQAGSEAEVNGDDMARPRFSGATAQWPPATRRLHDACEVPSATLFSLARPW
jgi:hypothetical protein